MNTVEHIVECYLRHCKGCFTMGDVKVERGNNRQCDLLAYNVITQEQYHVESSVTHRKNHRPSTKKLGEIFDKKFRGVPPKREGDNTDYKKGKIYYKHITDTYRKVGFVPSEVQRVFVTWVVPDQTDCDSFLAKYKRKHRMRISVWSIRDEILPKLIDKISTSNYEDEVLRTLSLLKQMDLQTAR